jgi:hypothetical protein
VITKDNHPGFDAEDHLENGDPSCCRMNSPPG